MILQSVYGDCSFLKYDTSVSINLLQILMCTSKPWLNRYQWILWGLGKASKLRTKAPSQMATQPMAAGVPHVSTVRNTQMVACRRKSPNGRPNGQGLSILHHPESSYHNLMTRQLACSTDSNVVKKTRKHHDGTPSPAGLGYYRRTAYYCQLKVKSALNTC